MADYMTPEVAAERYPSLYAKWEKEFKDWSASGGLQSGVPMPVAPANPGTVPVAAPMAPVVIPPFNPAPALAALGNVDFSRGIPQDGVYDGQTYKNVPFNPAPVNKAVTNTGPMNTPVTRTVANTGPTNTAPNWGVRFREWGNNIFNKPVGATTVMPQSTSRLPWPTPATPLGQTVYQRPKLPIQPTSTPRSTPIAQADMSKLGAVPVMKGLTSGEMSSVDYGSAVGTAFDGGSAGSPNPWATPYIQQYGDYVTWLIQNPNSPIAGRPNAAQVAYMQQNPQGWEATTYVAQMMGVASPQQLDMMKRFVDGYIAAGGANPFPPVTPAPVNALGFTQPQPFIPRLRAF